MKKTEFLLQLAQEQLTDEQIREEFKNHYGGNGLERAKWDLKVKIPCCLSTAIMACEKLDAVIGG